MNQAFVINMLPIVIKKIYKWLLMIKTLYAIVSIQR